VNLFFCNLTNFASLMCLILVTEAPKYMDISLCFCNLSDILVLILGMSIFVFNLFDIVVGVEFLLVVAEAPKYMKVGCC